MATGGWGGLSGGAWGAKPVETDEVELQSNSARPVAHNKDGGSAFQGAYGQGSADQENTYVPPASLPAVSRTGPAAGAYGQANGKDSGNQSFNTPQSFNKMVSASEGSPYLIIVIACG